MEDSQLAAAQKELDQPIDLDDMISEVRGKVCKEIEQYLWTSPETAQNLLEADNVIFENVGTEFVISEILYELAKSDGLSSGVTCNPTQIYGFLSDLLYNEMSNDSALNLAGIIAEYVTQDVESIETHLRSQS